MNNLLNKLKKIPIKLVLMVSIALLAAGIILNLHIVNTPENVFNNYEEIISQTLDKVTFNNPSSILSLGNKAIYTHLGILIANESSQALNNAKVAYEVYSAEGNHAGELFFTYDPQSIINDSTTIASYKRTVTSKIRGTYALKLYAQFNYTLITSIYVKMASILKAISPLLIIIIILCLIGLINNYNKMLPTSHFDNYSLVTLLLIGIIVPAAIMLLYKFVTYEQIEPNLSTLLVIAHTTSILIISAIIMLCEYLLITQIIKRAVKNPKYDDLLLFAVGYVVLVLFSTLYFNFVIGLIIAVAAFFAFFIYFYYALKRTDNNISRIHNDPTSAEINTKFLFGKFKIINNNLIGINTGFSDALEKSIKNERLKSELITNVSHDIKTPLTSIINYVDLLKKPDLDKATATEYLEVIDRQAARLKKLITDLIDASKASTGQVKTDIIKCDIGIMTEQLLGEYSDRLNTAGLTLATPNIPQNLYAKADAQCTFRCMDNLLSNICKYSLNGTRVYVDLIQDDNNVDVVFKNISRETLSISPDELMERFVRGDASRNTEGSGLGLSIVSSLMKLMNGELILTIDGDLFKAALRFPK